MEGKEGVRVEDPSNWFHYDWLEEMECAIVGCLGMSCGLVRTVLQLYGRRRGGKAKMKRKKKGNFVMDGVELRKIIFGRLMNCTLELLMDTFNLLGIGSQKCCELLLH